MGVLHLSFDSLTTIPRPALQSQACDSALTPALYRSPSGLATSTSEPGCEGIDIVTSESASTTMGIGASPFLQDSHFGEDTSSFTFSWTPILGGPSAFGPWEAAANADHGGLCSAVVGSHSNFSDSSSSNSGSTSDQPGSPVNAPSQKADRCAMPSWNDATDSPVLAPNLDASDEEDLVEDLWPEVSNGRSLRRVRHTAFGSDPTGASNHGISASGGGSGNKITPVTLVAPAPKLAAASSEAAIEKLCSAASPPELRLALAPTTIVTALQQPAWDAASEERLHNGELHLSATHANSKVATEQQESFRGHVVRPDTSLELAPSMHPSAASSSTGVGSLFQRRAQALRAGEMPAPKPIGTSTLSGAFTTPISATPLPAHQHSQVRTATFPLSQTWNQLSPEQQSRVMRWQNNLGPNVHADFARSDTSDGTGQAPIERAAVAARSALQYAHGREVDSSKHQGTASAGFAYTSMGLLTPISPLHALAPSSARLPSQHVSPASSAFRISSMPGDITVPYDVSLNMNAAAIGGNALGLSQHFAGSLSGSDASLQGVHPPTFGAFSSEASDVPATLFHKAPPSAHSPGSPRSPSKAKSAPNLRSQQPQRQQELPSQSPRRIASNRRLNASSSMSMMPSEASAISSFHHGRPRTMTLSSASSGRPTPASPSFPPTPRSGTGISFVNYGIEDADELCAAVAPSGSYKIPLRGYGSAGDIKEAGEKAGKSARREGPRWEERKGAPSTSGKARSVKRRKSVPNLGDRASVSKDDIPPVPPLPPAFAAERTS